MCLVDDFLTCLRLGLFKNIQARGVLRNIGICNHIIIASPKAMKCEQCLDLIKLLIQTTVIQTMAGVMGVCCKAL